MAYNPYNAVNSIYNFKGDWAKAYSQGDEEKKKQAEEKAKKYYEELRSYGYADVADELESVNYTGAKKIRDYYAQPAAESKESTVSDSEMYSQTMRDNIAKNNEQWNTMTRNADDIRNKYSELYGYANRDVTKTDEYKSVYDKIVGKYDLEAMQGRDNELANGSSTNGGNIDSFSAANALRQQAALTAKGQELAHSAGIDAYKSRIDGVRGILESMGVQMSNDYASRNENINMGLGAAQQMFDNAETAKLNDATIADNVASVTGQVPASMLVKLPEYSAYFNSDGSLKNPDMDYKAEIQKADARGDKNLAKVLRAARGVKIFSDYNKYGRYDDGDYTTLPSMETAAIKEAQKDRESAENMAKWGYKNNIDRINAQESTATYSNGVLVGDESGKPILSESAAKKAYESGNRSEQVMYAAKYFGTIGANDEDNAGGISEDENGHYIHDDSYEELRDEAKKYTRDALEPFLKENANNLSESGIIDHLIENAGEYNLKNADARIICEALGIDTRWLDDESMKDKNTLFSKRGFGNGKSVLNGGLR